MQEGRIGLYKAIRDYDISNEKEFRYFAAICITRNILTAVRLANSKTKSILNNSISIEKPINENEYENLNINDFLIDTNSNSEEILIKKENKKEFEEKLKTILTEYEIDVFYLKTKGYSYEKISEKLGKNIKSIDNTMCRIRKKIKGGI